MIDAHMHYKFNNKNENEIIEIKRDMESFGIDKAILYMIDSEDFYKGNFKYDFGNKIIKGIVLDPRDLDIEKKLLEVKKYNVKLIKILPYEQSLFRKDYPKVCELAKLIQANNMVLTICGSYGTKFVFDTNGVEMAAEVLKSGYTGPLIIAHGGMVKCFEAYSLMAECPNVYIDVSFTISYWWGSRLVDDLAFIMKKMDYKRIFWGSDTIHNFETEIKKFNEFCEKYNISYNDVERIKEKNFLHFEEEFL